MSKYLVKVLALTGDAAHPAYINPRYVAAVLAESDGNSRIILASGVELSVHGSIDHVERMLNVNDSARPEPTPADCWT